MDGGGERRVIRLSTRGPIYQDDYERGRHGRLVRSALTEIADATVLMFCLVPIGLVIVILPESSPERAGFVGAHQALGLTVLLLVIGRIEWITLNPPPPPLMVSTVLERRAASAVHVCLYIVLLAFPISGYLIGQDSSIDLYGWAIPPIAWPRASKGALPIHSWALPALLYAMLGLHLGAVLKRHFGERDRSAVRRMLR